MAEEFKGKDVSALLDALQACGESLAYATFTTLDSRLQERLVISEFFHALNRRGLVPNHLVENAIGIANLKAKQLRYPQVTPLELERLF